MGLPTVFVRASGCNLRCSWCDTEYSYEGGEDVSPDDILEKVGDCPRICLTGGEPTLQEDCIELIEKAISLNKQVLLETNGSVDLSGIPYDPLICISMDIKCPSSGMTDRMVWENLSLLTKKDQLKFIIADKDDEDFAVDTIRSFQPDTNIVFGPVGGTVNLERLTDRVLVERLDVRVLPQLHKIIWGDRRGV